MRYPQLPIPHQLISDPNLAWNFWLLLHELSELLWQRHEPLFFQWARDEFGDEAGLPPQTDPAALSSLTADRPGPPSQADLATPSTSGLRPIVRFQATDDDIPF